MNAAIRRATMDDAGHIARLATQLMYDRDDTFMREALGRVFQRPDHAVLVAEINGVVVGWIHLMHYVTLTDEPLGYIAGLVVDEEVRGAGIGTLLVAAGEQWAASQGLRQMFVRSRSTRERAHAFYLQRRYEFVKDQKCFRKKL